MVVHGDDFTALGDDAGLIRYEAGLLKSFDLKLRGRLGHGPDDLREIRLLNRVIRLDDSGLRYEADPRHAELLGRALGLEECKPQSTPGAKHGDDLEHGPSHNEDDVNMMSSLTSRKLRMLSPLPLPNSILSPDSRHGERRQHLDMVSCINYSNVCASMMMSRRATCRRTLNTTLCILDSYCSLALSPLVAFPTTRLFLRRPTGSPARSMQS